MRTRVYPSDLLILSLLYLCIFPPYLPHSHPSLWVLTGETEQCGVGGRDEGQADGEGGVEAKLCFGTGD